VDISFTSKETKKFLLLQFELKGPIAPDTLRGLERRVPKVVSTKGVVISGRGPTWLYCTLVHVYHPALWVAVFDPRIGGGVVVASHTPQTTTGDIIPVSI